MTDAGLAETALLEELRDVAVAVASEAAALVRRYADGEEGPVGVAATKSSEVDVVTEADRAAEALLRRRLGELRPDDGFFGEEGGRAPSSTGVTWVVDPIDGTVNFLYGIPHYCVSVAAVDEDIASLAGAVVNVPTGEVFAAARGLGATVDGATLTVRTLPPLRERLVLTGFQYQERIRALQGDAVARLLPHVRDIRREGSAALELCQVAAGRADVYVEEGLHLWDRAAAALVATEAGARVERYRGVGGMDCVVCTPAAGFEETLALVTACGFLAEDPDPGPPRWA